MNWAHETTRTIDLGYEQLLTFEGRPGTRIRVLYGAMWLTEEGSLLDVFARGGDEVTLRTRGRSVIEGLGAARVQLIEVAQRRGLGALSEAARRLWDRVRWSRSLPETAARSVIAAMAVVVGIGVVGLAAPGPLPAAVAAASVAAPGHAVLADIANAGTGFLAVN